MPNRSHHASFPRLLRWLDVGNPADSRHLAAQVAFVFILVAALTGHQVLRQQEADLSVQRQHALSAVESNLRSLSQTLQQALSATHALAALVRQGRGEVANFDAVAAEMLRLYPGIGALQLAPQGIVRSSMPLKGNEQAIGHNLLADPARTREAFLARDSGRLTLAGPFRMIQGGLGAVGRYPVFIADDQGKSRFWGFTSVVLRFPDVLDSAGLQRLAAQGYHYVLWRRNPESGERLVIAKSGPESLQQPVEKVMDIPNGQWTLSIEPRDGWGNRRALLDDVALGLLITCLLTAVAAMALRHPLILRAEEIRRRRVVEESEARFRQFFEKNSSVMLIVAPDTGLVVAANDAAAAFYGTPRDRLIGMKARDIGDFPAAGAGQVLQHRLADGELRDVEIHTTPIVNGNRELSFSIVHDVTERRRIERQLAEHREHLEELVARRTADLSRALADAQLADQTKTAFLANMSHELRTPLNAVIGLAALARNASRDPGQCRHLDHIVRSGKHLNHIIDDLLDLSRITAGKLTFETSDFSLRTLVDHVLTALRPAANAKGLRFDHSIAATVPDCLRGDSVRIEQILLNLLDNAIKFTTLGRIGLSIDREDDAGDRVRLCITVEDTGIGMRDEDMQRLFQPFAQVDASVSRQFGGTGLGLAISKRLAEMMDGSIAIESRAGVGTTLRVRLPLPPGDPARLEAAMAPAAEPLPQRYEGVRALVVDDQVLNREIIEALLVAVGIEARLAGNGQEALEILDEAGPQGFDLVLMDIQMPVMDGLVATRTLRERPDFGSLPIIAVTAHTMIHEVETFAAAGMNDHIRKPFDNAAFYRVIARWIKRDKARGNDTAAPDVAVPAGGDAPGTPSPALATTDLRQIPGLDFDAALARFSGKEALYRRWLADFADKAEGILASIRGDIAAGELKTAARSAHALKGKVGMLGMGGLHGSVSALERALVDGGASAALLDEVTATTAGLVAALRAGLGSTTPVA